MLIRPILPKDITEVYELLVEYFKESQYADRELDTAKTYITAGRSLLDTNYFGVVLEDNGELVGVFLGTLSEYIFNEEVFAQDVLYYVHPKFRGKAPTRSVLATFSDWALSKGAKEVRLSVTSGISTDRTTQLYNKLGYLSTGTFVSKEI